MTAKEQALDKFLKITGASREVGIAALKYAAEQGLWHESDSDPVKMARVMLFAKHWKNYSAEGHEANIVHTLAYVDAQEEIEAKAPKSDDLNDVFPPDGGFENREKPAPAPVAAPPVAQPPAAHGESPVVVFPSDKGDVMFNGRCYSVTLRIGGTADMVLALLQEWDRVWQIPGVAKAGNGNGKLEPGATGAVEIDEIVFATKRWENETKLYAELWRDGKQFATDSSAKEGDIALAAAAAGIEGNSGQSVKGKFRLHYKIGNLKPPKKDGSARTGTAPWDYYWNWERIEKIA